MPDTPLKTVSELYVLHRFTPYLIDLYAGVPSTTTNLMMRDVPVSEEYAERVLIAISGWAHDCYTLDNVKVNLLPKIDNLAIIPFPSEGGTS